jgi:hypothetical protein
MHALQGPFQSVAQVLAPRPPFLRIAMEYVSAPDRQRWIHIPCIVTLREPETERFILEARNQLRYGHLAIDDALYDVHFHRRNWLIEIRERIPEVFAALEADPHVVRETVARLGPAGHEYRLGAQMAPQSMESLQASRAFRGAGIRPVTVQDMNRLLHRTRVPRNLRAA